MLLDDKNDCKVNNSTKIDKKQKVSSTLISRNSLFEKGLLFTQKEKVAQLVVNPNRKYNEKNINIGKLILKQIYMQNRSSTLEKVMLLDKSNTSTVEEDKLNFKLECWFIQKLEKAIFSFNIKRYKDCYKELYASKIIKNVKDFSEFLLVTTGIDKSLLGEFLAKDKGMNKNLRILKVYMTLIELKNVKFLDCLRFLFNRINLPKDACLILTIIDEFTKAYYQDNSTSKDFTHSDDLYLLCSGILALNTTFTRTDIKNMIVMKKEDFIKMNKKCSAVLCSNIYDELKDNPFIFNEDYNELIHKKFIVQNDNNEIAEELKKIQLETNNITEIKDEKYDEINTNDFINLLLKGDTFTLYEKNNSKSTITLKLSQCQKYLIYMKSSGLSLFSNPVQVPICNIKDVFLGTNYYNSSNKKIMNFTLENEKNCCSILTTTDTINIQHKDPDIIKKFVFGINFLIRKYKTSEQIKKSHSFGNNVNNFWNTEILPNWDIYRKFIEHPKYIHEKEFKLCNTEKISDNVFKKELNSIEDDSNNLSKKCMLFYSAWHLGLPKKLRPRLWKILIKNKLNINESLFQYYESQIEYNLDFDLFEKNYNEANKEDLKENIEEEIKIDSKSTNKMESNNNEDKVSGISKLCVSVKKKRITFLKIPKDDKIISDVIRILNKKYFQNIFNNNNTDKYIFMKQVYTIIKVFTMFRSDINYSKYFVYFSAIFLLISNNYFQAFVFLANFLIPSPIIKFSQANHNYIKNNKTIFENLLSKYCPTLKEHFDKIELPCTFFLTKWFETAFTKYILY